MLELNKVLENFDGENHVKSDTGYHHKKSATKDLKMIVNVLHDDLCAASVIPGRKYCHFKKFQSNINRKLKDKEYKQWISERVKKLVE